MLLFVVQLVALRKVGIIARDVVNYWAFVVAFAMIDFSPPMSAALQLRYRIHALRGDYCWLRGAAVSCWSAVTTVHHISHRSKIVSRCCSKACKHVSRA
jgi:hypothetical protein